MATIRDVAREANVSIATVSNVINGSKYVSPDKTAAVRQAIDALNYNRDMSAVSLRKGTTKVIGFVGTLSEDYEFANQYFLKLIISAEAYLKQHGYSVLISNCGEDVEQEMASVKSFSAHRVEGMIVVPTAEEQDFVLSEDIPVVFADRYPLLREKALPYDVVLSDSFESAYSMTLEQIKRGKKRFGVMNTYCKGFMNVNLRCEGLMKAVEEKGISFSDSQIANGEWGESQGYNICKDLFERHPDIDSLFITMNGLAPGAVKFLKESGRCIPKDVNVTVFDDFLWNDLVSPTITTIRQNAEEIGVKAAEALLDRIQHRSRNSRQIMIPTKLLIRESWD